MLVADHQRKLIRHAVITMLKGATVAGQRVSGTRRQPIKPSEIPAVFVFTPNDKTDEASKDNSPRELWIDLKLEVAGFVILTGNSASDDDQDAMDDIAQQIQDAMDVDRFLLGTCWNSILDGTEAGLYSDGDPRIGVVTLTYDVSYSSQPNPPTGLVDLQRAGVTTKLEGGVIDTPTAQDLIQEPP